MIRLGHCLVTGGAGFIGSHLVEALVKRGECVRVLDNFSTGKRENIEAVKGDVEVMEGDVRSLRDCQRATRGIDVVFHEAAIVSIDQSGGDADLTRFVNFDGTYHMLSAAREAGAKTFVFASSCAAYGDILNVAVNERDELMPAGEDMPLSLYARTKLDGERLCEVFSTYGLNAGSLCYFNVFGPRQNPNSAHAAVIPAFLQRMSFDLPPVIYGDGEQARDFIYVDDVVEANIRAAQVGDLEGDIINIGSGVGLSVNGLVLKMSAALGKPCTPIYEAIRHGDIRTSRADISKAKARLGWEPRVSFDDGLARTIQWYQEHGR